MPTMDEMIAKYEGLRDGNLYNRTNCLYNYSNTTGKIMEIDYGTGYNYATGGYSKIDKTSEKYLTLIPLIGENYDFTQKDFTVYVNTITARKSASIYAQFGSYSTILIKTFDIMFRFCPTQVQFMKLINIVSEYERRHVGQLYWLDVLEKNDHIKVLKKNIDKLISIGYHNIHKYVDQLTESMYIDLIKNIDSTIFHSSDPFDQEDEDQFVVLSYDDMNKLFVNEKDNDKIKNIYLTLLDGYGDDSMYNVKTVYTYTNLLQYYIANFDPNYKLKSHTFNTIFSSTEILKHDIFTDEYLKKQKMIAKGKKVVGKALALTKDEIEIVRDNISQLFGHCQINEAFIYELKKKLIDSTSHYGANNAYIHAIDIILDIIGKDNYDIELQRAFLIYYLSYESIYKFRPVDWSGIEQLVDNEHIQLSIELFNHDVIGCLARHAYDIKAAFEYLETKGIEPTSEILIHVINCVSDGTYSASDDHNNIHKILEYLLGFKLIPSKTCMISALSGQSSITIIKMLIFSGGVIDHEVIGEVMKLIGAPGIDIDSILDLTEFGVVYDEGLYDIYHKYGMSSKHFDHLKEEGNMYTLYSMIRRAEDITDYIKTHNLEYDAKLLELAVLYERNELASEIMETLNPTPLCLLFCGDDNIKFRVHLYDRYMETIGQQ
jgi:hypothetical protein